MRFVDQVFFPQDDDSGYEEPGVSPINLAIFAPTFDCTASTGLVSAGRFIQFADQMKQQRLSGLWEPDIPEFVDDDAIQGGQLLDDLPGVSHPSSTANRLSD